MSGSSRQRARGSAEPLPPPRTGFWAQVLRWLGLSGDTRAQISAPGISVVISGEPDRVRHLLGVVTDALERESARRTRAQGRAQMGQSSRVVEPSELDEMDSPYALPEADALVRPARDEMEPEVTYEIPERKIARLRDELEIEERRSARPRAPSPSLRPFDDSSPSMLGLDEDDANYVTASGEDDDEPDIERTAVEVDPRSYDVARVEVQSRPDPMEATLEAPAHRRGRGRGR